jgi:molybdate transport system substrate-binding protein
MAVSGYGIEGTFGAVGAMKARLEAGEAADVAILTSAAISELLRDGLLADASARDIGLVEAALAIRAGDPKPVLTSSDDLRATLLGSDAIYLPDPNHATSGVHFVAVLTQLGIKNAVWERVKVFPGGALAMRALANSGALRPVGCTQATEIVATSGTVIVGPLPPGFELATVYTAAVTATSTHSQAARQLLALLADEAAGPLGQKLGFKLA